jgi:hypothetical protein
MRVPMAPSRPLRLYSGPPGDEREYWLPRDEAAWYAAWDAYRAEHPLPANADADAEPAPDSREIAF